MFFHISTKFKFGNLFFHIFPPVKVWSVPPCVSILVYIFLVWAFSVNPFERQYHKTVKHTQTAELQIANCRQIV